MPGGLVVENGWAEIEHRSRQRLPFGRVRDETRYVGGHFLTPVGIPYVGTSPVPCSSFRLFLVHFFQMISAGRGARFSHPARIFFQ